MRAPIFSFGRGRPQIFCGTRQFIAAFAVIGAAAASERELQVTDTTFSVLPAPKSSTYAASRLQHTHEHKSPRFQRLQRAAFWLSRIDRH